MDRRLGSGNEAARDNTGHIVHTAGLTPAGGRQGAVTGLLVIWLLATALYPVRAQAPAADPPTDGASVGKLVVQRFADFSLRVGNEVIDRHNSIRIYRVETVQPPWLWLQAQGSAVAGWARAADIVPIEEALSHFTRQISASPGDAFPRMMRATLLHERQQLDASLADYDEAIRLDPTHAWVFNNRGIALTDRGELDKALADFEHAIRLEPNVPNVYNNRGSVWRMKKVYTAAIADFDTALRLSPRYMSPYYNRGLAFLELGQFDRAIADFDTVAALSPTDASTFYHRGIAYVGKKQYEPAIADFGRAIQLDATSGGAYYQRGLAWSERQDFDKAIADYNEAIRRDPKDDEAYRSRGLAWTQKKAYPKALADFEEAVRLNPQSDDALTSRAWLLMTCPDPQVRNPSRAIESATKACELTHWSEAYELGTLAAACAEAGQFDDAAKWQAKALDLWSGQRNRVGRSPVQPR